MERRALGGESHAVRPPDETKFRDRKLGGGSRVGVAFRDLPGRFRDRHPRLDSGQSRSTRRHRRRAAGGLFRRPARFADGTAARKSSRSRGGSINSRRRLVPRVLWDRPGTGRRNVAASFKQRSRGVRYTSVAIATSRRYAAALAEHEVRCVAVGLAQGIAFSVADERTDRDTDAATDRLTYASSDSGAATPATPAGEYMRRSLKSLGLQLLWPGFSYLRPAIELLHLLLTMRQHFLDGHQRVRGAVRQR